MRSFQNPLLVFSVILLGSGTEALAASSRAFSLQAPANGAAIQGNIPIAGNCQVGSSLQVTWKSTERSPAPLNSPEPLSSPAPATGGTALPGCAPNGKFTATLVPTNSISPGPIEVTVTQSISGSPTQTIAVRVQWSPAVVGTWPPNPNVNPIPVAIAPIGKKAGDFTQEELHFLATHASFVAVNGFGPAVPPSPAPPPSVPHYAYVDDGDDVNAKRLHEVNPSLPVLEYWGFHGDGNLNYRAYDAKEFVSNAFLPNPAPSVSPGETPPSPPPVPSGGENWYQYGVGQYMNKLTLNYCNPDMRAWWVRSATQMVIAGGLDGMWIDGGPAQLVPYSPNGKPTAAEISEINAYSCFVSLLQELRASFEKRFPQHKLIIFNGYCSPPSDQGYTNIPSPYFNESQQIIADGCMHEHYDLDFADATSASGKKGRPATRDEDLIALKNIMKLGNEGVTVEMKLWPTPYSYLDPVFKSYDYLQQINDCREPSRIDFALASFLIAEVPGKTFAYYSWGYDALQGAYILSDASGGAGLVTWYPELSFALGAPTTQPIQDPNNTGDVYQYVRFFENGVVKLDLEAHTGSIQLNAN